jgi:hypothetical protein
MPRWASPPLSFSPTPSSPTPHPSSGLQTDSPSRTSHPPSR